MYHLLNETLGILNFYSLTFFQPPAFLPETPESIKEYIKEKYLLPRLDPDEFSPQNAGRQWEFDWFDKAKILPEPSLPRSVVVPKWELPFRRSKGTDGRERWEPSSEQVCGTCLFFIQTKGHILLLRLSFG